MKKDNKTTAKSKREAKKVAELRAAEQSLAKSEANSLVVGVDLGDTSSAYCARRRDSQEIVAEGTVKTNVEAVFELLGKLPRQRVVMETGTHSRWVAELLELSGHEVIVANARRLKLITENLQKSDKVDARLLSEMGCVAMNLLNPVYRRSGETQRDLTVVRAREALVEARSGLINCVRGTVKSFGCRLRKCSAESFARVAREQLPEALKGALGGIVATLEELNQQIRNYEEQIRALGEGKYREATQRLTQVRGVGPVTSLTYVLTIEDKERFERSRDVGAYLGLVPRKRQSGSRDPQLGISKAGDVMLRKLLVNCAHYMLGEKGEDSDLRRWGLELVRSAQRKGRQGARKLGATAVARKLAVLLHRLWVSGAKYEPLRGGGPEQARAA